MIENGVPGIEGVDTRALVRRTRERGALKGIVSTSDLDDARLVEKAKASPGLIGRDLTLEVMGEGAVAWEAGFVVGFGQEGQGQARPGENRPHVVSLDFGMKWNIPRHLVESGCRVTVVPGSTPARAILEHEPDGIFLSNGPGDPAALAGATEMVRSLIKDAAESRGIPIFGICLGHQLLGQAFGGKTFKLKFGHRGPTTRSATSGQGRSRSRPRTTASRSTPTASRPTSGPATSTSTTRPSKGSAMRDCRFQACSITPRRRPAPTTAVTCSPSSAGRSADRLDLANRVDPLIQVN